MAFEQRIRDELLRLERESLYRSRQIVDGPQGAELDMEGKQYLNFSSNDYLGLANHPRVAAAFKAGIDRYGSGTGAAHLVSGHSQAHHALEEELAEFTGRDRALLFSSGYMANLGSIAALVGRGDHVLQDRLNHASLLDAGLLSGARHQRFHHRDTANLDQRLQRIESGETLVISDGVFSMDGDIAPIAELAAATHRQQGWLIVDDAHGFGVLGPHGEGCTNGASERPDIIMGTLGKAFGTSGAFVAGDTDLIEYLIQKARPYIYTTAIPSALAEATRASLKLLREQDWRRQQLNALINKFRNELQQAIPGIRLMASSTAIQPLIIGSASRAIAISQQLREAGILATAIRPPTVPEDTARLRITLRADHQDRHIERLISTFRDIWTGN